MDKTPVQQAIDERLLAIGQYKELKKTYDKQGQEALGILLKIMQNGVDTLTALLPTERQFAETCFDAGYEWANDKNDVTPDFDNFFKKYTHD